jgi:Ankyrin repeats (3 copies)
MYVWHMILQEGCSGLLAERQHFDGILAQLLQRGAAVDGFCNIDPSHRHAQLAAAPTSKYATALGLMVHCSCAEAIELLVKLFEADVNAVSDAAGHTAVSQACAAGYFETVKLLLQLGGNLHSTLAGSLQNPLHEAVAACSTERVTELLRLDAEYCSSNTALCRY